MQISVQFRSLVSFTMLASLFLTGVSFGQAVAEQEKKAETKTEAMEEDLPSADDILADNLKAVGGREKFEKLKSLIMKGEMEMQGMKTAITIHQKAGGSFLFHTDIPQIGEIKRGKKGDFGWEVNPMAGPRIVDGAEFKSFEREADIASALNLDKYYKEKKCVGTEEINGEKCYKVVMVTVDGEKVTNFYEADSKLMVRTVRKQKSPMGVIPVTANLSDYREKDGFLFPHMTKSAMVGMEQVMRVNEIIVNDEIDDSIFDAPEEVLALQKKQKKKAEMKAAEAASEAAEAAEKAAEAASASGN